MGLSAHLYARLAAFVLGFVGGFALHVYMIYDKPDFNPFLIFASVFGGAFLAQIAFCKLVPAACPACGQKRAMAKLAAPLYTCRACGAASDASETWQREQKVKAPILEQQARRGAGFFGVFALIVGLGLVGLGAWLGSDSIRLLREGVSTPAQVIRLTEKATYERGVRESSYAATIAYRVGQNTLTFERRWSVGDGKDCAQHCYHQGQRLDVIYLPAEPSRAEVHSFRAMFWVPAMLGGLGLMSVLFGIIFMLLRRLSLPKPEL